jgi:hypothetical protein
MNIKTTIRRLAALAIVATAVLAPAVSAEASTTYSGGTVSAGASCNRYYHSMTIKGTLVLSDRFPNGAFVATRYAYYTVDKNTLARTSSIYTTGWMYSTAVPSTQVYGDLTIGGGPKGLSSDLPAWTINTWGQFRVMAQVGVWNGSYYEFSNWDTATGYDNYGQFGIYSYNVACLASLT